ncbi:MAG TPA: hypothetical protein VFO48_01475, partial [Vicinamibacterales bacterium]|nr:hypothetical protein [Vicinamibacterales bacterium]
ALGQVGVKVIFPGKNRLFVDSAVERERRFGRKVDGPAVEDRQRARKPEAYGADVRVRGVPEPRTAAAEYLGVGEEPGVYFEPNNGFKSHDV